MPVDTPALLGADEGNTGAKGIKLEIVAGKLKTTEVYIPYAYLPLSESNWDQVEFGSNAGRARSVRTHTFRYFTNVSNNLSIPVTIGQAVQTSSSSSTILGSAKYVEGVFDAYFVALLCEAFPRSEYPKGHDNLYVVIGVPSADWMYTQAILSLINRVHYIQDPDGCRRKFVVRQAMTADENGGGMVNAIYRLKQETLRDESSKKWVAFRPDDTVALLDSGGWLGSIARGTVAENGHPLIDYTDGNVFAIRSGIVPVREALLEELKRDFKEIRGANHLDNKWLDKVLKQGYFTLKGDQKQHSATEAIKRAAGAYISPLKAIWTNNFDSGQFTDIVVLTGGTVDPLFDEIIKVLDHKRVVLAEERSEIYMANVRGMMHILIDKLRATNKLPKEFIPFLKEA